MKTKQTLWSTMLFVLLTSAAATAQPIQLRSKSKNYLPAVEKSNFSVSQFMRKIQTIQFVLPVKSRKFRINISGGYKVKTEYYTLTQKSQLKTITFSINTNTIHLKHKSL